MKFFELAEKKSIGKVYIDMDGVIVNLYNYIGKKLGVNNYNDITPEQWDEFYEKEDAYDLFKSAPAFSGANKLIQLVKDIAGGYSILSKPLNFDREGSIKGKREWLAKHLDITPDEVIFQEDKSRYAVSNNMPNILIDDEGKHISAWNSAGGFGIKYKADEDSLVDVFKELKKIKKETETTENIAENKIGFSMPNFNSEWEEAERYPEFVKLGKEEWIELAKKGKAVNIKSAKGINNTDAADPDSFKSLEPEKQKRALAQLEKGEVEMPIVALYSDGYKELIGGNTRLTAMMAKDGQATVWAFYVPDEVAELAENFADGKVKGKSRPGRVKRAGASCNGSVTDLRKRAKNASGEKAKMYHWCANMKSGRSKKGK